MTSKTTAGVIATFNQAAFIVEAVASLADQVDELVVVDDASSDDTSSVLAAIRHSNVRVLRNEHRSGVSHSFNVAVEATSADVIFVQGGDDRSTADRVERQLKSLDRAGTVLCSSVPLVMNQEGARLPDWVASEFFPTAVDPDTLVHLFSAGNMICAPAAAMFRSDFIDVGGFNIGLDFLQDYQLWLKLAQRGTVEILQEPVVEYRKHTTNLSREHLGIDSPRRRRERAEWEFILTEFLENAPQEALVRLATAQGIEATTFEPLERREMIALIQLGHPDRLLVRRGLAFVFQKLGEKDSRDSLDRMGLDLVDIGRLAVRADHDNGEDVSRALGVRENFDELASARRHRRRGNP